MIKFLIRLRNIFLYCGLTKDEYRTLKRDAYVSNFQVWKTLHILLMFGYLVLAGIMCYYNGFTAVTWVQLAMAAYLAAAGLLFLFVLKPDALSSQLMIYCTMILLFAASTLISIFQPRLIAVTFIALLVMLPMFMIDKPYFMAILLALAVAVYLLVTRGVKPVEIYHYETVFTVYYGIFGIFINTFYNFIRVREFRLRKREHQHIRETRRTAEEAEKLNGALRKMSEGAIELLGDVVEGRDAESGEHIRRVKGYAYLLARQVMKDLPEYGLDDYTVDLIAFTSALHDVGKISISDAILCKPGRLTPEEFEIMKTHCDKGCEIIEKMRDKWSEDYLNMGMDICRYHHEKWDGKGYPKGLKGDEIPIAAQIVSIADVFDALTTKRVYKDAYSYETAYEMIRNGECGAYSEKLLGCFFKCFEQFKAHAANPALLEMGGRDFELVSRANPQESFVIGLHDDNRTLREKLRLDEELSVLETLSEWLCYACYVVIPTNEVIRFRADGQFSDILDSFGDELPSNEKFDKLLNTIIVAEDYANFRADTDRTTAMAILREKQHITTDFRIRLEDGVHYCRMRISADPHNPDAVIIGITKRDEEHKRETEYAKIQNELENARREMENREKLEDRLAVIECVGSEYDYICTLNADTMHVSVYLAEPWIRDMFKNLEDIVVSPEVRETTLKGVIHKDDFEQFRIGSRHENVLRGLAANGTYTVNYRAYKYGRLVHYQTRYTIDSKNPKRIIIGLRENGGIRRDDAENRSDDRK